MRSDFTHHSTDRSFFFGAEILHKPHLLQRQLSFSPAWQTNVDQHVHRICLAHGRWMDWRLAQSQTGKNLRKTSLQMFTKKKVEIPRRTHRHLWRKSISPICRRIDQTRGTRRTSSFTATFLPPRTSVPRQSTIQANVGGTPNWRASCFNFSDKAFQIGRRKVAEERNRHVGISSLAILYSTFRMWKMSFLSGRCERFEQTYSSNALDKRH